MIWLILMREYRYIALIWEEMVFKKSFSHQNYFININSNHPHHPFRTDVASTITTNNPKQHHHHHTTDNPKMDNNNTQPSDQLIIREMKSGLLIIIWNNSPVEGLMSIKMFVSEMNPELSNPSQQQVHNQLILIFTNSTYHHHPHHYHR